MNRIEDLVTQHMFFYCMRLDMTIAHKELLRRRVAVGQILISDVPGHNFCRGSLPLNLTLLATLPLELGIRVVIVMISWLAIELLRLCAFDRPVA